jgi:uncharacterized protein
VTEIVRQPDGSYTLHDELLVGASIDDAFAFLGSVDNLEPVIPEWLGLQVLTPRPVEMGVGTTIEYRLRIRGIPRRWRSEFTVWEPSSRFAYEQRRGPFTEWIHEHRFTEVDDGTLVRDDVRYRVPGGRLLHDLFVRRDLERLFRERRATLSDRLRS